MCTNKGVIFFCRSIPAKSDSRFIRFINLSKDSQKKIKILQWGGEPDINTITSPIIRVRDRPLLNVFLTPLFSVWLFLFLIIKAKKNDQVFAIDLDTALPTYIASLFKKFDFIFDIADPFSICRFNRSYKIINSLEGYIASKAWMTTIPTSQRSIFYNKKIHFNVIENLPDYSEDINKFNTNHDISKIDNNKLIIGYFGTLESNYRNLELIASVIEKRDDVFLFIAGRGGLKDFFIELASSNPDKFYFLDGYSPEDLPSLAKNTDVMLAGYSTKKIHHKYIASNKMYEHLFLGLPLITNTGTNLSEIIYKWQTGWLYDETNTGVNALFDRLTCSKDEIIKKGNTAKLKWDNKYSSYWLTNSNILALTDFFKKTNYTFFKDSK